MIRFYQCSQQSYIISPIALTQLPLSPIKTIIIWLTRQTKTPKKVGTFLGKYPWWSPVLIKSQSMITEAGLQNWYFSWRLSFFFSENPVCGVHGIVLFWFRDAFLAFDRKALLHSLSELILTRTWKNSYLEIDHPPYPAQKECLGKVSF